MTRRRMLMLLVVSLMGLSTQHAYADKGSDGGSGSGGEGSGGGDHEGDDDDDDGGDDDDDDDGDGNATGGQAQSDSNIYKRRISDAVKNGKAAPLKDILAIVRQQFQGEVVRIRLTGPISRLVYNIRIVDTQDRLIEVRVNALSRRIISTKGL